ncbi:hypothetical protein V9J78_003254 [Vibrio cholerae]
MSFVVCVASPLGGRYVLGGKLSILHLAKSEDIESALSEILSEIKVDMNERTWVMDYLYQYSHLSGNCLPRGRAFDKVRDIQNSSQWNGYLQESLHLVMREDVYKQFSPYLVSQIGLIRAASIERLSPYFLDTDHVLDIVKKLEGLPHNNFASLSKHEIKFKRTGILGEYKHHHIPMKSNSYVDFLSKPESKKILSHNLEPSTNKLDFNNLGKLVRQKKSASGGRITGHWLISKEIDGMNYYLGLFPHGVKGGFDDKWIYKRLIESEISLKKRT